jgi:hypothetical protein
LAGYLEAQYRQRRERRLRGHAETIGERFERDRAVLLPLPAAPYEACEKQMSRVNSLSLVRYRANDYSVPTAYGHHEVLVKGYVHDVTICYGTLLYLEGKLETKSWDDKETGHKNYRTQIVISRINLLPSGAGKSSDSSTPADSGIQENDSLTTNYGDEAGSEIPF